MGLLLCRPKAIKKYVFQFNISGEQFSLKNNFVFFEKKELNLPAQGNTTNSLLTVLIVVQPAMHHSTLQKLNSILVVDGLPSLMQYQVQLNKLPITLMECQELKLLVLNVMVTWATSLKEKTSIPQQTKGIVSILFL